MMKINVSEIAEQIGHEKALVLMQNPKTLGHF